MEQSALIELLEKNNDLLTRIYVNQLFVIGVAGACIVIVLLYKFLRKFF